jgi:hypothetical protein
MKEDPEVPAGSAGTVGTAFCCGRGSSFPSLKGLAYLASATFLAKGIILLGNFINSLFAYELVKKTMKFVNYCYTEWDYSLFYEFYRWFYTEHI